MTVFSRRFINFTKRHDYYSNVLRPKNSHFKRRFFWQSFTAWLLPSLNFRTCQKNTFNSTSKIFCEYTNQKNSTIKHKDNSWHKPILKKESSLDILSQPYTGGADLGHSRLFHVSMIIVIQSWTKGRFWRQRASMCDVPDRWRKRTKWSCPNWKKSIAPHNCSSNV